MSLFTYTFDFRTSAGPQGATWLSPTVAGLTFLGQGERGGGWNAGGYLIAGSGGNAVIGQPSNCSFGMSIAFPQEGVTLATLGLAGGATVNQFGGQTELTLAAGPTGGNYADLLIQFNVRSPDGSTTYLNQVLYNSTNNMSVNSFQSYSHSPQSYTGTVLPTTPLNYDLLVTFENPAPGNVGIFQDLLCQQIVLSVDYSGGGPPPPPGGGTVFPATLIPHRRAGII